MTAVQGGDDALRIPGTAAGPEPSARDWGRLEALLAPHYAGGLFTILQVDRSRGLVRRARSSNPGAYPPGGTKRLLGTPWALQVIDEGKCFMAATRAQMEAAFADHAVLSSIGCTTALNLPLRQGSDVAWTVNLLRGGAVYTQAESRLVRAGIEDWIGGLFHG
ncbi:MAG: hypothetical protein QM750_03525 [Rubrivivax sp.]